MSVTESKMIAVRGTFTEGGKQDFTIRYRLKTNALQSPIETWVQGLTASPNPLPDINDAFPGSARAFCKSVAIDHEHEARPTIWLATASFGELGADQDNSNEDPYQPDNPLDRDTVWRVDWETIQEVVSEDNQGQAIVNSAGQPFNESIYEDRRMPVLVARKNYADWAEILDIGAEYDRSINSTTFQGFEAQKVKWGGVVCSDPQWENGVKFYEAAFRFVVNSKKWFRNILDRGIVYLDGGELKNFRDADGQVIGDPQLLDGSGGKLPQGQVGVALPFYINEEKNFNSIGL